MSAEQMNEITLISKDKVMKDVYYKDLDDCIPDGKDFQKWVWKIHLNIHPQLSIWINKRNDEDQRRKWVNDYNNSLPQVKYYENTEEEYSYAVDGIYDSVYMNYVFDGIETKKIKKIKKIQKSRL